MPRMTPRTTLIAALGGGLLALGAAQGFAMASRPSRPIAEARPTGPARSCVPLRAFSETRVRDDRTIDFLSSGKKGWRNVLPYGCPGLASANAFTYKTSLSELCSTDFINVLDTVGGGLQKGAACGLGQFQPIELVK